MDETNQAISGLALAAQQAALLRGALTSGFLAHLGGEIDVAELARRTGLGPGRVRDLCVALRAAGVLACDNPDRYRLSGTYAPLLRDGADVHYANLLGNVAVRERLYSQMFTPEGPDRYADLSAADRAATAAGSSVVPSTALARQSVRASIEQIPVFADALSAGDVRYLELGCGLSGHLLTLLDLYPKLTAVGVDLAGDLLELARADAEGLGVAGRIRYVEEDAAVFTDPEPFDIVYWSQLFFPAASRAKTLANAHRLLRPGGLLVVAALPGPAPGPVNPHHALRNLLLSAWDVPVVTADELRAELASAGFTSRAGNASTVVAQRGA